MKKLYLQAVIIKKPVEFGKALKKAKEIMKRENDVFFRETEDSYRFRNLPKTRFDPKSFRSKKIDETTTLLFGHLLDAE